MTINEKVSKLEEMKFAINADSISIRKGVYTVRRGYFYSMGGSAEKFAAKVQAVFTNAHIIESGDHWTQFNGGAPLARNTLVRKVHIGRKEGGNSPFPYRGRCGNHSCQPFNHRKNP